MANRRGLTYHSLFATCYSPFQGLVAMLDGGPGVRNGSASLANSHSNERVLRGSMISSTQNFSAERNGERSLLRRSSISCSLALGSSAASISALYGASMPPSIGREP